MSQLREKISNEIQVFVDNHDESLQAHIFQEANRVQPALKINSWQGYQAALKNNLFGGDVEIFLVRHLFNVDIGIYSGSLNANGTLRLNYQLHNSSILPLAIAGGLPSIERNGNYTAQAIVIAGDAGGYAGGDAGDDAGDDAGGDDGGAQVVGIQMAGGCAEVSNNEAMINTNATSLAERHWHGTCIVHILSNSQTFARKKMTTEEKEQWRQLKIRNKSSSQGLISVNEGMSELGCLKLMAIIRARV